MRDSKSAPTSIARHAFTLFSAVVIASLASAQQNTGTEQKVSSAGLGRGQAQVELQRLGVEFNARSFLTSVDEEKSKLVDLFLVAGIDPNSNEIGGITALMIAAGLHRPMSNGGCIDGIAHPCYSIAKRTAPVNLDILRLLIKAGATVQASDGDGETALHKAAVAGNTEIAKILIDHGADVNRSNRYGSTPLALAASTNEQTSLLELLVAHGAIISDKDSSPALLNAAAGGHLAGLRFLISKGANENSTTRDGTTALMEAASGGHTETIGFLLDRGAKIDAQDRGGYSALMYAAFNSRDEVVKLLLERGANKALANHVGETAAAIAAKRNFASTAKLLE